MNRWSVIAVALVFGFLLVGYDRRTDDTGIEVAILAGSAFLFALLAPRVPIAIALAIALPMAMFNGSVIALVISSVGAGIGAALGRGRLSRAG